MSDQPLMDYFKFDEADLFANRSGQFSEKQKARLTGEGKSDKTKRLVGGIFLLVITAFIVYFFTEFYLQSTDNSSRIQAILFGVVMVLIFGGFGLSNLLRAFATFHVKLVKVEGPVNILKVERESTSGSSGHTHTTHYFAYEMHIGGKSFDVQAGLADIMMQADIYDLYYSEGSENDILSAELISKAK
jgi:hypothetical protein